MSNTKGSISGAGTVYRSGEPGITQRFLVEFALLNM